MPGASSLRRSSHTSRSRIAANPSPNFDTSKSDLAPIQVWRHRISSASRPSLVITSVIHLNGSWYTAPSWGIGLSHIRTEQALSVSAQRAALPRFYGFAYLHLICAR